MNFERTILANQKAKDHYVWDEYTVFLLKIIVLLRFLNCILRNNLTKFKIEILIKDKNYPLQTYGRIIRLTLTIERICF